MSISELINQHGIGIYMGCGITFILSLLLLFCILFVIFGLLIYIVEKGFSYFYNIKIDDLKYIIDNFYKIETLTHELKSCQLSTPCCEKSARYSSRK